MDSPPTSRLGEVREPPSAVPGAKPAPTASHDEGGGLRLSRRRLWLNVWLAGGAAGIGLFSIALSLYGRTGDGLQGTLPGIGATLMFGTFFLSSLQAARTAVFDDRPAPGAPDVTGHLLGAPDRSRGPVEAPCVNRSAARPMAAAHPPMSMTSAVVAAIAVVTAAAVVAVIGGARDQQLLAALLAFAVAAWNTALRPPLTEEASDLDVMVNGAWLVSVLVGVLGAVSDAVPGAAVALPLCALAYLSVRNR